MPQLPAPPINVPAVVAAIVGEFKSAELWVETRLNDVGQTLWGLFTNAWQTLEPTLWADLIAIIQTVLAKSEGGDSLADIFQAVLMEAETQGKEFVATLSEDFLTAVIALLRLPHP